MKKSLAVSGGCQLSAIDRWGGYICTAVLTIAGIYFAGQVVYAWWLGRFADVSAMKKVLLVGRDLLEWILALVLVVAFVLVSWLWPDPLGEVDGVPDLNPPSPLSRSRGGGKLPRGFIAWH